MNLKRYRILEDGSHSFHTFIKGQRFNIDIWLEDNHSQRGVIGQDEDNNDIYGDYYKYYNEDLTPNLEKTMLEDKANTLHAMETAIQEYVDNQAKELGYDDMNSTAKYLRPSSPYYNEAIKLGDWCDAVWAEAFTAQNEIESGAIEMLTVSELLSRLPDYQ